MRTSLHVGHQNVGPDAAAPVAGATSLGRRPRGHTGWSGEAHVAHGPAREAPTTTAAGRGEARRDAAAGGAARTTAGGGGGGGLSARVSDEEARARRGSAEEGATWARTRGGVVVVVTGRDTSATRRATRRAASAGVGRERRMARERASRERRAGRGEGACSCARGGGRRGEAPRARARRAPLKIAPRESFWRDHPVVVVVERRNPSAQTGRAGDSGRRATRADDEARRSRGREGGHCARRAAPPSALPTRWARAAFAGTRIRRRRSPGYDPPRVNPPPAARIPRDSPPHAVHPSRDGVTNRALCRSPRRRVRPPRAAHGAATRKRPPTPRDRTRPPGSRSSRGEPAAPRRSRRRRGRC